MPFFQSFALTSPAGIALAQATASFQAMSSSLLQTGLLVAKPDQAGSVPQINGVYAARADEALSQIIAYRTQFHQSAAPGRPGSTWNGYLLGVRGTGFFPVVEHPLYQEKIKLPFKLVFPEPFTHGTLAAQDGVILAFTHEGETYELWLEGRTLNESPILGGVLLFNIEGLLI